MLLALGLVLALGTESLDCWDGVHTWSSCCNASFGASGNALCWIDNYTYEQCCAVVAEPEKPNASVKSSGLERDGPTYLTSRLTLELESIHGLNAIDCWDGMHTWNTCCNSSFGAGGNAFCWVDNYTYDQCCGVVAEPEETNASVKSVGLDRDGLTYLTSRSTLKLDSMHGVNELDCWDGVHTWITCCNSSFGAGGNTFCWIDNYTYEQCCGVVADPEKPNASVKSEGLDRDSPAYVASRSTLGLDSTNRVDALDCWDGVHTWDTCCNSSFGAGGNAFCWVDKYTYEQCCDDVAEPEKTNYSVKSAELESEGATHVTSGWTRNTDLVPRPDVLDCWDAAQPWSTCCNASLGENQNVSVKPERLVRDSSKYLTLGSNQNLYLVRETTMKYDAWKREPTFHNLQRLWLATANRDMFVTRRTSVPGLIPAFNYMFPANDHDNQHLIGDIFDTTEKRQLVAVEPHISYHLARDLRTCCATGGHFLDVGGNFGWYALLAAAMGCEVDSFEPVPWFAALLQFTSSKLNNKQIARRIKVHTENILGRASHGRAPEQRTLVVPMAGVLGTAGVDGANSEGTRKCGFGAICLEKDEVAIDELHLEPSARALKSCAIKVDVEGFEPEVFAGARRFISLERPKVIVTELSPSISRNFDPTGIRMRAMLNHLASNGYTADVLNWGIIKNPTWSVVTRHLENRSAGPGFEDLLHRCQQPVSCMVYFRRA